MTRQYRKASCPVIRFSLWSMALIGLLMWLPIPEAQAYCAKNNTTSTTLTFIGTIDGEEVVNNTLSPGSESCFPSSPSTDDISMQVNASTDDFLCIVDMFLGGVFELNEQIRAPAFGPEIPPNLYCVTRYQEQSKDVNGDGILGLVTSSTDVFAGTSANPGPMHSANRSVRFLVTADPQFIKNNDNEDIWNSSAQEVLATMVEERNNGTGDFRPRGIVIAGDLTQSAGKDELEMYTDATAGIRRLFFDGIGNHHVDEIEALDLETVKRQTSLSFRQGPHYSWDWHDVHLVQLNVFPSDTQHPDKPYDPFLALTALRDDLEQNVGNSGRPVILIHHYGFDPFSSGFTGDEWWTTQQRNDYMDLIEQYNVVALFTGHTHLDSDASSLSWRLPLGRCQNSGNACQTNGAAADYCGDSTDSCVSNGMINYVAGAARGDQGDDTVTPPILPTGKGAYLDVKMTNCNQMFVIRRAKDGAQVDEDILDFTSPTAMASDCVANAVCQDLTQQVDHDCEVPSLVVSELSAGSSGDCSAFPPGPYATPGDITVDIMCIGELLLNTNGARSEDSCQSTLTVVDATPPIFSEGSLCSDAFGNSPQQCGETIAFPLPMGKDNCSGVLEAACVPHPLSREWQLTDEEVTCKLRDASGNESVCASPISVVDTRKPLVTPPGAVEAECNSQLGTTVDIGAATATDSCDPDPEIRNNAPERFPLGDTMVEWSARDSSGNEGHAPQKVTITDITAPLITAPPAHLTDVQCVSSLGTIVDIGSLTARDACSAAGTEVSHDAPAVFPIGTTVVQWTVTDISDNSRTYDQVVTVVDTIDPTISAPADLLGVECANLTGAQVTDLGLPTVSDSCYPEPDLVTSNNAPATFPLGTTYVLWEVKDPANNADVDQQTVTVVDTKEPDITCPMDITVEPIAPEGTAVSYTPTTSDQCDSAPALSCDTASGSTFAVGSATTVTCTSTDASTNQDSCSFLVTVLSEMEVVENLNQAVEVVAQEASLNNGLTNSLLRQLDNILRSVESGNTESGCDQLEGFQNEVTGLVNNGALTDQEAAPLLETSTNLKQTLQCS